MQSDESNYLMYILTSFPLTDKFQIKELRARELFTYSTKQDHIKAQLPYELVSTQKGFKAILINGDHLH